VRHAIDVQRRRPELLEELQSTIRQRTYGRLTDLSLQTSDGAIVVSGRADTYHTVQLAVSAIKSYRSRFILPQPVELSVDVQGRALVLSNMASATNTAAGEERSIQD
jgi:hypothetical protein